MTLLNQPPQPAAQPEPQLQVSIQGRDLIVPVNYRFPQICLITGERENLVPKQRQLTWHPPAVYFTILIGVLVYVILAMVLRKTSRHSFYLTQAEHQRRRKLTAIFWTLFLSTFGFIAAAIALEQGVLGLLAAVALLASIIFNSTKLRLLYPSRITSTEVRVRGIRPMVMEKIVAAQSG